MSVIVKGMEMPENGAVLVVKHEDDGKVYIKHAGIMGYSMEMVELPEKHGRLIDGDALREKMYHDAKRILKCRDGIAGVGYDTKCSKTTLTMQKPSWKRRNESCYAKTASIFKSSASR